MTVTAVLAEPFGGPLSHFGVDSGSEQWLAEFSLDLSAYSTSAVEAVLAAAVRSGSGHQTTFFVRRGGTSGETNGTVILIMRNAANELWTCQSASSGSLTVGTGSTLFKLTGLSGAAVPGEFIDINSATLTLTFSPAEVPPTPPVPPTPTPDPPAGDSDEGTDIWASDTITVAAPEYVVTNPGDWASVGGREALQQSLLRRYLSPPGSYRVNVKPYGAGLQALAKKRMRKSEIALAVRRIREQSLADERVASVISVTLSRLDDTRDGMKFSVWVQPIADDVPLEISGEVF
jgi:hypothetical protein